MVGSWWSDRDEWWNIAMADKTNDEEGTGKIGKRE